MYDTLSIFDAFGEVLGASPARTAFMGQVVRMVSGYHLPSGTSVKYLSRLCLKVWRLTSFRFFKLAGRTMKSFSLISFSILDARFKGIKSLEPIKHFRWVCKIIKKLYVYWLIVFIRVYMYICVINSCLY